MKHESNLNRHDAEMTNTTCPYCLSDIPSKAQVCRYCGRDVGRLLEAKTRLSSMAAGDTRTDASLQSSTSINWGFRITMWIFYVFATVILAYGFFLNYQLLAIAICGFFAGLLAGLFSKTNNVWIVFIMGFVQFPISLVALLLFSIMSTEIFKDNWLAPLFISSLRIGGATALGGLTGMVALKREISFSIFPFTKWLSTSESHFERIEKVVVAVASIITALALIASKLVGND